MSSRLSLLLVPFLATSAVATVTPYADYWMGDSIPSANGSGNLPFDSSGNGRHMTGASGGTPAITSTGGPVADAYYTFNGTGTGFYNTAATWNPPEDNVGVEVWVRTSNETQTGRHVFGTGSNLSGLNIGFDATGGRGWYGAIANVANVGNGVSPAAYQAGNWIHLAVVRSNGVASFYVNGVVNGASSSAVPVNANGTGIGSLHLAIKSGGAASFAGDISGARVFTFAAGDFNPATDFSTEPPPGPAVVSAPSFPTIPGKSYLATFQVRPTSGNTTVPTMALQAIGNTTLKSVAIDSALPVGRDGVPYWVLFTADSALTTLKFTATSATPASAEQIVELKIAEPWDRPASPTPSAAQQAQIKNRYGLFLHFGINTFHNQQWTDGTALPSSYQPTAVDVDQWVRTAYEAGMQYVLIIAKHHDGFCMWNSPWTNYDIGASPVTTDVLAQAGVACKKYGIKLAVYYSLWDRHEPSYASKFSYNQYMLRQLTELLTNYGPVCELWFDGGWDAPSIDWGTAEIYDLVHRIQPDCQVGINYSIGTPGNPDQHGVLPASQQEGYPIRYFPGDFRLADPQLPKFPDPKTFTHGGNSYYMPFEATITLSSQNYWFYDTRDTANKPLSTLLYDYYATTAQDNLLVLNAPPDRDGKIRDLERNTLFQLRDKLGLTPGQPLPKNLTGAATGIASAVWTGDTASYGPQRALDGNPDTRWAVGPVGTHTASLEIDLHAMRTFDRMLIDEYEVAAGVGRITAFHLERWDGSSWQSFHTGTTCGRFSLHSFSSVTTTKVRLVIDSATEAPSLWEVQVHHADHALSSWRELHFPNALEGLASSIDADPDADGLPNGMEFALLADPLVRTSLPSPRAEDGQCILDLTWNPAATAEHAVVDYSFDLTQWFSATAPIHPGISFLDQTGNVRRWAVDAAGHPKWFYRLRQEIR